MNRMQQIEFCEGAAKRHEENFKKRMDNPAFRAALSKYDGEAVEMNVAVRAVAR